MGLAQTFARASKKPKFVNDPRPTTVTTEYPAPSSLFRRFCRIHFVKLVHRNSCSIYRENMDKKTYATAGSVAAAAAAFATPIGIVGAAGFAISGIVAALNKSQEDLKEAENKGISSLEDEAKKQRINMEFQAHQARVSQELAIAQRIYFSNTVEIEEFYDGQGKGSVGVKGDESGITLGASGEGRRVTKRIIKFAGWGQPSHITAEQA